MSNYCISSLSVIDFINRDKRRVVRKINGDQYLSKKIFTFNLDVSFQVFKKSYKNFIKELEDARMKIECEIGESCVLDSIEYKNPDYRNILIVEAYFYKKS